MNPSRHTLQAMAALGMNQFQQLDLMPGVARLPDPWDLGADELAAASTRVPRDLTPDQRRDWMLSQHYNDAFSQRIAAMQRMQSGNPMASDPWEGSMGMQPNPLVERANAQLAEARAALAATPAFSFISPAAQSPLANQQRLEQAVNGTANGMPSAMPNAAAPTANQERLESAIAGDPLIDAPTPRVTAAPGMPGADEARALAMETAGIYAGEKLLTAASSSNQLTADPQGTGPRQTLLREAAPRPARRQGEPLLTPARRRLTPLAPAAAPPSPAVPPTPAAPPAAAAPPSPAAPPPPAAAPPADTTADEAVATAARRRGIGGRTVDYIRGIPAATADAVGYIPPDFGAGRWVEDRANEAAASMKAKNPGVARVMSRGGRALGLGVRALPVVGAALPVAMGAAAGMQDGPGGAVIQGGGAAAGAAIGGTIGTFIAPGLGTAIGAGIGGMIGDFAGGAARQGAVAAVNAAQGGDTGVMGAVGRALDPMINSAAEREAQVAMQQLNSPAMAAIRQQQERRELERRYALSHDLLMQSYLQGAR